MTDSSVLNRDTLSLALVLLIGVAGTGVVRRQSGVWGFNGPGRVAFVLGYGDTVFAVWYGWIRPLDTPGPDSETSYRDREQ